MGVPRHLGNYLHATFLNDVGVHDVNAVLFLEGLFRPADAGAHGNATELMPHDGPESPRVPSDEAGAA